MVFSTASCISKHHVVQNDSALVLYRETSNTCKTQAKMTDRFPGSPQHFQPVTTQLQSGHNSFHPHIFYYSLIILLF